MKADFENGTKICSRCKKELPLENFWKSKSTNDGLVTYCKKCCCKYGKEYYEKNRTKIREYQDRRTEVFGRKGHERGNCGILKRDYELNEEQLKRRNAIRKRRKYKKTKLHGIMIWYSGKLNNLNLEDYTKEQHREYNRQRVCAIRGYVGKVQPSEHFLFDFDLEQMLKDNVYFSTHGEKKYITRWWKGNIRHWTVKDGIWKE